MPFSRLLLESLLPGKTQAEDKANNCYTSTDLKAGPDETVLLFRLDNHVTKKNLGLSGKKCCDHLYFYKDRSRILLIVVELKASNLAQAVEQLSNAIESICEPRGLGNTFRALARAVVVTPTVSPRDRQQITNLMRKRRIKVFFGYSKRDKPCQLKQIVGLF